MLQIKKFIIDNSYDMCLVNKNSPRFSWQLLSDQMHVLQKTYRFYIQKDSAVVYDTGDVACQSCFSHTIDTDCLVPMTEYRACITVEDMIGEIASAELIFMTAPAEEDWADAKWIRPEKHISGWAPYLRTKFHAEGVTKAMMYACGLGCAEYYINGRRTDDFYMDPPMTNYEEQVMYRHWDVTDCIADGGNALCVLLGEGFYAQSRVWGHTGFVYGKECVRLMLFLSFADGHTEKIVTNTSDWTYQYSPISVNNVYGGETYDCRLEINGFSDYNSTEAGWGAVVEDETPKGIMTPCQIPPVRVMRELPAQSVTACSGASDGAWIFDMGENFAGIAEFHLPWSPRGAVYVFRFAETLNEQGNLDFRSIGTFATQCIQQEIYICRGDQGGEVYRPRFCYHGFRYVEMTGFHDFSNGYGTMPWLEIVRGLQLTTDMPKTGTFHTSYAYLDRLYRVMDNTYRSNFHGFPEDCPAREKCGWLGDAQVCVNFGLLSYDSTAAYEKYLDDIRTTVDVYGVWQMISPGKRGCGEASPLWGCAQIIIPYYLWLYRGDKDAVLNNFDRMEAWVAHEKARAEDSIITVGLGDWCPPEGNEGARRMPVEHSSTFMYYEICRRMEELCTALSIGDAAYYGQLAETVKDAAIRHFYDAENHTFGYWGSDGVALETGLYPNGERDALLQQLVGRIHADNYAMPTGIYCNKYLVPVLMEAGYTDIALDFLFNQKATSFGTMLDDHATTIWEDPETHFIMQDRAVGVSSYNHPMHGGFLYACYTHVAGIRPVAAGYAEFIFSPCHSDRIAHVDMMQETPAGIVAVCFDKTVDGHTYTLTVPAGAVCTLQLQNARAMTVNGAPYDNGARLGSGTYTIITMED